MKPTVSQPVRKPLRVISLYRIPSVYQTHTGVCDKMYLRRD